MPVVVAVRLADVRVDAPDVRVDARDVDATEPPEATMPGRDTVAERVRVVFTDDTALRVAVEPRPVAATRDGDDERDAVVPDDRPEPDADGNVRDAEPRCTTAGPDAVSGARDAETSRETTVPDVVVRAVETDFCAPGDDRNVPAWVDVSRDDTTPDDRPENTRDTLLRMF